jgi:NADH-quinone oxidoreductase subunit G
MSRIRITLDGIDHEVDEGRDLLSACLSVGVDVPHFCWHDALGSVGACRLCAVRVFKGPDDTLGKIEMACMTPATKGQRVESLDSEAANMRARVIEWLMVNHPHDCAVCEEGGACHLQDMTVATGHRTRRFRFEKRTHRNQYLGPLLTHEMNRCIACYRCTRFYRQYAGGRDLDVFGAHDNVYFGRATDGVLESPFAGNLAEVCPTGVFNDKGWSGDYARKWDMAATPSVCSGCSVGCNMFVAERSGRVRRVQNRYNGAINGHFLCDKGRFGALHVAAPGQILEARVGGADAPMDTALAAARAALVRGAVALGSPRATLETNFVLRRLVGQENFFAGIAGSEARIVARMAALLAEGPANLASLHDIETADAAIVLGEDLTATAPRAALTLRQTARAASLALAAEKGVPRWLDNAARVAGEGRRAPIALLTAMPDALDDIATWPLRRAPAEVAAFGQAVAAAIRGEAVEDGQAQEVADALRGADAPAVIAGLGTGRADVIEAAGAIARALGDKARLAFFPPEANSMGLALIGQAALEECVTALESGPARTVIVAENDLFERADAKLVERLFAAASDVIVLDSLQTRTSDRAALLLPVANWAEAAGTFVNHAGRAQRIFAAYDPQRPAAWRVIAALMPTPPIWENLDDVLADMGQDLPQFAGAITAAPDATTRTPLGQVARAPWRMSGRTAHDRAGRIAAGTPATDPDSALAFSMEGAHGRMTPPELLAGYETPGLHSASGSYRFIDAADHTLKGGDPGVALIGGAPHAAGDPLEQHDPGGEGLLPLILHDPFTGTETTRAAPRLIERAPAPLVMLHPADAARLSLATGALLRIDGHDCATPLVLSDHIPKGHIGLSAGRIAPRGLHRRVTVGAAS